MVEKIVCNLCGKSFSKSGMVGHMKFKHARSVSHPMLPDDSRPAGMLSEDSLTCPSCRSQDMDAVSLQGDIVEIRGTVEADNLLSDTKTTKVKINDKYGRQTTVHGKPVQLVASLAEHAPAGKKFLELKCRHCGARKIISISVS